MAEMVRRLFIVVLMLGWPLPLAAQDSGDAPESETAPDVPEGQGTLDGEAVALNGGTIVINDTPVRLYGIEVPDVESAEGRTARVNLDAAIDGRPVSCEVLGVDRNQMRVARCAAGDDDLSLAQLMSGVVAVNRVHTRSEGASKTVAQAFDDAEAEAREAGVGLWRQEPGLSEVVAQLKAIEEQEPKVVVQPAAAASPAPQQRASQAATSDTVTMPAMPSLGTGVLVLVAVLLGVVVGFGLAFFGTWWLQRRRAAQERLGLATALYEEILGIGRRLQALAEADDTNTSLRAMLKANSMVRTRTLAGFSVPGPVIYANASDRLGALPADTVGPVVSFYTTAAALAANVEAAITASPTEQLPAPHVRAFAERWLEAEERCGEALVALRKVVNVKGGRSSTEEENRTAEALRKARRDPAAGESAPAKPAPPASPSRPDSAGPTKERTEPTV